MTLTDLLTQKKPMIIARWLRVIFDSYPPETAIFLKKEKDRFDNPMGSLISEGIAKLYETLLVEMETDQVLAALDEIIRIRALQNFSPGKALAFIFLLKDVVRQELAKELQEGDLAGELLELESRIDGLALMGFEVYTTRREKLNEIRINEMKNRVSGLMRRTGLNLDPS
jgi:hypothetical protein